MTLRANSSGIALTHADAALIKGMLARGDRQHDIAAWFGVNGGRIGEISTGATFWEVQAAPLDQLPPPGPYPIGKAVAALSAARAALDDFEAIISTKQA